MRGPTVNLFLWDAHIDLASPTNVPEHQPPVDLGDGRRWSEPCLSVHYLTTVWCERERDEHHILGEMISLVWARSEIEVSAVEGRPRPARLRLTRAVDRRLDGVWAAMQNRLRPALDLVVTTPVSVEELRAPVTSVNAQARRT